MLHNGRTRAIMVSLLVGVLTCGYYLHIVERRTRRATCSRVVFSHP